MFNSSFAGKYHVQGVVEYLFQHKYQAVHEVQFIKLVLLYQSVVLIAFVVIQ